MIFSGRFKSVGGSRAEEVFIELISFAKGPITCSGTRELRVLVPITEEIDFGPGHHKRMEFTHAFNSSSHGPLGSISNISLEFTLSLISQGANQAILSSILKM